MSMREFQGQSPVLGRSVYIDSAAVVIGAVALGDDVSVWPGSVIRGDVHRITVGAGSNIQDGSVLHVSHQGRFSEHGFPLIMGERVTVGHRAVVHGCTVGHECLIGIGAILMDGAVIADQVMIGAGTLVPPAKVLESGYLYIGSPARQARRLKSEEFELLRYSSEHYVKLKNQYLEAAECAQSKE